MKISFIFYASTFNFDPMEKSKSSIGIVVVLIVLSASLYYFMPHSFPVPKSLLQLLPSNFYTSNSELEKLKEENRILIEKLVKMNILEKENRALKDQFQTSMPSNSDLIPARVIGAPKFIPGISALETLILDQGSANGVKKGQGVIVKNQLVGKISRVSPSLSVVDIVTTDGFTLTAKANPCPKCKERVSQTLGVLKGKGEGEMILDNVVLSEKIEKDDIVVTKGDIDEKGVGFPAEIIVGRVLSIEKKSSELFQAARVKSLIDFPSLTTVFIIK